MGMSGRSASNPVHAARASLSIGGFHIGCAAGHLEGCSPAAENSGVQSIVGAAPTDFSTCGGTSTKCVRRPSGFSSSSVIPDTSRGGSSVHTVPNMGESLEELFDASGRGLPRYQNTNAPVSKLSQRVIDVSCSVI